MADSKNQTTPAVQAAPNMSSQPANTAGGNLVILPGMGIPPFIEGKKVNAAKLAQYARMKLHLIVVAEKARQGIKTYVFEDGRYTICSANALQARIKQFIENFNPDLVKMSTVKEAYNQLTTTVDIIADDELNADATIINFKNGNLRIDASGLSLVSHSSAILTTIQIPCNWSDDQTPTPVFDSYMDKLTGGDLGVQKLLLEVMGVALSNIPGYRMKRALFLYGPGNTGKSQFFSLLTELLGQENYAAADLAQLEARFGSSSAYGKRLVGCPDMSYENVRGLAVFKSLTGGDSIFAEIKCLPAFSFVYRGILVFCGNQLPHFAGDHGDWVYNRIMPVFCGNVVADDEQDPELLEKMIAEKEGIVHKAIVAAQDVVRNGFRYNEPPAVIKARKEYSTENNPVVAFFQSCMTHRTNTVGEHVYSAGIIARVFGAWSRETYGHCISAREFRTGLCTYLKKTYNELTVHSNHGTVYRDYTLTPEACQDYYQYLR